MESVLVIGNAGVGRSRLLQALQCAACAPGTSTKIYKMVLDTKYYSAEIMLRIVDTQHHISELPEALVLVLAADDEHSFQSIRKWAEKYDTEDIEVKLVVANKADLLQPDTATTKPQWLVDSMAWCYDNGFEYIETAAAHPSIDRSLQLDGDEQGVRRVLAALEAHMWPGMVEKQWRPSTAALDDPQHTADSMSNSTNATNGSHAYSESKQQQHTQVQQQPEEVQQEQCATQQQPAATATTTISTTQQQQQRQFSSEAEGAAADQEAFQEDSDLDDFEKLMKQAQGMALLSLQEQSVIVGHCGSQFGRTSCSICSRPSFGDHQFSKVPVLHVELATTLQ